MYRQTEVSALVVALLAVVIASGWGLIVATEAAPATFSPSAMELAEASSDLGPTPTQDCQCPGSKWCPTRSGESMVCYSCTDHVTQQLIESDPKGCQTPAGAGEALGFCSVTENFVLVKDLIWTCAYVPEPTPTPAEPGTILLAAGGLGVAGFYLNRWRRRSRS